MKHIINLQGTSEKEKNSILQKLRNKLIENKLYEKEENWFAIGFYKEFKIGLISAKPNNVLFVEEALNSIEENDVFAVVCENNSTREEGSIYNFLWEKYKPIKNRKDNIIEIAPINSYGNYGVCIDLNYDIHQSFINKLNEIVADEIINLMETLKSFDLVLSDNNK